MKITKPVIDLCMYYTLADNEADKGEERERKYLWGKMNTLVECYIYLPKMASIISPILQVLSQCDL